MTDRIHDLAGNDVTDCDYCLAFQGRDWQTVEWMQDHGKGCTCADRSKLPLSGGGATAEKNSQGERSEQSSSTPAGES